MPALPDNKRGSFAAIFGSENVLNDQPSPVRIGVTVMPEWFQCEGIEPVLDRLASAGVSEICTSPYLMELASPADGAREPPADGDAGLVRPLDRPLWGKTETWIRTAPSYVHDFKRFEGLRYQPSPPGPLTTAHPRMIDEVMRQADQRGIGVYLQVMAASPPGYRVQFSAAVEEDQCLGPDGRLHPHRVDKNASLASPHVAGYCARLLSDLALRYPAARGFRLDWPEYPPYDLHSALFDFSKHAQPRIAEHGGHPETLGKEILGHLANWQVAATNAGGDGPSAVLDALEATGWHDFFSGRGIAAPLWASKRAAVLDLLSECRTALDQLPGPRRLLEPQVFPPPFSLISGFPLDAIDGIADAVGVKLYTMHWPMIARAWARALVGSTSAARLDTVTAAMARYFDFCDATPDSGATFDYPDPDSPHPVGREAQRRKIVQAQSAAGKVPVIAFAHSYGPVQDVLNRVNIALTAATSAHGSRRIWINRYGYLSDLKLSKLSSILTS